jgi:two-component system sensor histidine kinase PilS (NtrC family)
VQPHELARLWEGRQWLTTIGVDIVAFTALHLLSPSSSFNYVALLVLPVLMAGVLTPRAQALATSAGVALALLCSAWLAVARGGDATTLMTQGRLGEQRSSLSSPCWPASWQGRLAREELTAKGSLELARQQAQLNRLGHRGDAGRRAGGRPARPRARRQSRRAAGCWRRAACAGRRRSSCAASRPGARW